MIGLSVNQAKGLFFDRARVVSAVSKAERRVLSKFGAFVRTRARSSIRTRKKASQPGRPPSSHTGILKGYLFFAYEPSRRSVVIGPAKTNQVFFRMDGTPVTGLVPEVLEYGGAIRILEVLKYGRWQRADLRSKRRLAGLKTRLRTVTIAPRPYMNPALRAEAPKFPLFWRDAVKAA